MQLSPFLARLAFVVLGISLFTFAPLRADDVDIHAVVEQIHGLLHEAMGGESGTPPPNAQRTDLLKKAGDLLEGLPPGRYHGHRVKAAGLIRSALDKIAQGDAGDTAKEDIRDADYEVRQLE
jgi:hypothetical protein